MKTFLLICAAIALAGCGDKYTDADGAPGGRNSYFPPDSEQRNMSQSGTSDVQIPLETRQQYAREHNPSP
jgi:hypothetical protein